ncbi:MAG TPA: hypothetical protein H9996_03040 [Candidatus Faecalibacterium avium]|nr:hypothetical protein [Candidatus Faecalibacterium avium]
MKLKKIASLMLAGVMAVSMLAGCKGSANSGEEENPVVPTTGVVAYANDAVSADDKEDYKFSGFTASTNLDSILKDLASSTGDFSETNIKTAYQNVQNATLNTTVQGKLNDKLDGLLDDDGFKTVPADNVSEKYGYIYTASGKLTQEEAVSKMVGKFADEVLSKVAKTAVTNTTTDTKYDPAYSAEVSVVRVSSSSASDESAWVLAIVLTQNVTKVSNTVE